MRTIKEGQLIVLEGACDGIGKTTQVERLREHLTSDGEKVFQHHFPTYDAYHGKAVKKYLAGAYGKPGELSPYLVHSLYAVDRAVAWYEKLRKQYNMGKTILLDRYTTSSLTYQASFFDDMEERKKFIHYVMNFEFNQMGIKEPDKIIFLEAPFDLVAKLRAERKQNDGVKNDVHERDPELMRRVYNNALFVADYLGWDKVQCNDGDQMRPIEDIHEDVYRLVKTRNTNPRRFYMPGAKENQENK